MLNSQPVSFVAFVRSPDDLFSEGYHLPAEFVIESDLSWQRLQTVYPQMKWKSEALAQLALQPPAMAEFNAYSGFGVMPYGLADIITVDIDKKILDEYQLLVAVGSYCLNSKQIEVLYDTVQQGATLIVAVADFLDDNKNINDVEGFKKLTGYSSKKELENKEFSIEHQIGKGKVILLNMESYEKNIEDCKNVNAVINKALANVKVPCRVMYNKNVSYFTYKHGKDNKFYQMFLLNHNWPSLYDACAATIESGDLNLHVTVNRKFPVQSFVLAEELMLVPNSMMVRVDEFTKNTKYADLAIQGMGEITWQVASKSKIREILLDNQKIEVLAGFNNKNHFRFNTNLSGKHKLEIVFYQEIYGK
jgi:hypothetical protein